MGDRPNIFLRGSITKRLFAKHIEWPSCCSVNHLFKTVLGAHVFGIYEDIIVQNISGVIHFLGTLRHMMILFLVFSATYLWICCIITDQVFGMRAFEASFNIWLAFKHLLQFDLTGPILLK